MATYYARKTGNINAADVWATTPSGTAAAVTFASGDVLVSNSFAIAINVDTNLGGAGQVRNDTLGGATAGGTFTLNTGVTLTANVLQNNATGGNTVIQFSASAPSVSYIVGNVTTPTNTSGNSRTILISSTGTLNFTGNATGDNRSSTGGGSISLQGGGTLNFTGNAYGGTGVNGQAIEVISAAATVNLTGNAYGGGGPAIYNAGSGTVNITGSAFGSITTGASSGVFNASTGTIRVTRAVGNAYGPGNTSGLAASVGASNSGLGLIEIEQLEFGVYGQSPVSGTGIRLKKANTNVAVFNFCDTAGAKTLVDATQGQMPAATDVRSGVSYASGAATGSCAVPAAGSVALGVPVDATLGTAVLTAAAIRAELATELGRIDAAVSSRLAPSGTLATVTTLTNAPASVTPSDIWSHAARTLTSASGPSATDIRQELDSNSTKLANLDTTVSSRLASSVSTNITAIKAKTDLLNTDRLAQCATTSIVGNLIAQSNS
ncbi:hypothetical protein UFOVP300_37 [uncultured Caudovirales phage]|uniref:Uncharacterized protein n=1 Tax=uncultured Caudovirales phage TaxID=2100421 RepID=A0A6J5LNG0_9CAUD|nr:hypothetical protein UFOVP300_37 [uncultured Caudovirales phage]